MINKLPQQSRAASALRFILQPILEISERIERRDVFSSSAIHATHGILELGMFMFMTIGAQEFPVAAIRRIVVVIAVLVMHFQ